MALRRLRRIPLALAILTTLLLTGCGPAVAPEELGHVVFEVPKVPGCERPFDMPQLRSGPLSDEEKRQSRIQPGPAALPSEQPAEE